MAIERIYGTDTGKQAFTKTDSNFQAHEEAINENKTNIDTVSANLELKADKATAIITDANLAIKNGKYAVVAGGGLNIPLSNHTFIIDVSQRSDSYLVQRAKCYSLSPYDTYERLCLNGTWSTWVKISTTQTIDIASNLRNGWTTTTGIKLVITGKMAHITGNIVSGIKTKNTAILDLTGLLIFDSRCSPTIISFGQTPAFGLLRVDNGSSIIRVDNNWDLILSAVDNIYMLDLHIPIM